MQIYNRKFYSIEYMAQTVIFVVSLTGNDKASLKTALFLPSFILRTFSFLCSFSWADMKGMWEFNMGN